MGAAVGRCLWCLQSARQQYGQCHGCVSTHRGVAGSAYQRLARPEPYLEQLFLLGGLAIADGGFTLDCSFPFRCPGARNLVVRFRTAALASGSHIEFPGCCRCSAGDRASSHRGHEYPLAGVGQNRSRLDCYTPRLRPGLLFPAVFDAGHSRTSGVFVRLNMGTSPFS